MCTKATCHWSGLEIGLEFPMMYMHVVTSLSDL